MDIPFLAIENYNELYEEFLTKEHTDLACADLPLGKKCYQSSPRVIFDSIIRAHIASHYTSPKKAAQAEETNFGYCETVFCEEPEVATKGGVEKILAAYEDVSDFFLKKGNEMRTYSRYAQIDLGNDIIAILNIVFP